MSEQAGEGPARGEQLATMIAEQKGANWKGATFCRDCNADSTQPLTDEAFVALQHRSWCRVRLTAERDAATARAIRCADAELVEHAAKLDARIERDAATARAEALEDGLLHVLTTRRLDVQCEACRQIRALLGPEAPTGREGEGPER